MNKMPNYQKIYKEITERFHQDKIQEIKPYLNKKQWNTLDVMSVNNILTDENEIQDKDRIHKAYDEQTINAILQHQKEFELNNSELARYFKISRNTVLNWKKRLNNQK